MGRPTSWAIGWGLVVLLAGASCTAPVGDDVGPFVDVNFNNSGPWGDTDGGCRAQCEDRECGPDGCGGSCGTCTSEEECSDEGVCGRLGVDPCAGTECLQECVLTNVACVEECIDDEEVPVGALALEFLQCAMEQSVGCGVNVPMNQAYLVCWASGMVQNCQAPSKNCFVGEQGCTQVAQCMNECPPFSGSACYVECFSHGTIGAKSSFVDYLLCSLTVCEGGGPDCMQRARDGECKVLFDTCTFVIE